MKQSKRNYQNAKAKEQKALNYADGQSKYSRKGPAYDYSAMYGRSERPRSNRG